MLAPQLSYTQKMPEDVLAACFNGPGYCYQIERGPKSPAHGPQGWYADPTRVWQPSGISPRAYANGLVTSRPVTRDDLWDRRLHCAPTQVRLERRQPCTKRANPRQAVHQASNSECHIAHLLSTSLSCAPATQIQAKMPVHRRAGLRAQAFEHTATRSQSCT